MNKNLLISIKSITDLPKQQEEQLFHITKDESLNKGDIFIREGQIPRKFAFVNYGLFRYYYIDQKGNESTKGFSPENTFLISYTAMIQNRISYFTIEALENANISIIDYIKWKKLYEEHICWRNFLVSALEKAFEFKETREREFLLFDAETRYKLFLQRFPGLELRVKQHIIASYLGITPVALSRIRKKMGLVNIS